MCERDHWAVPLAVYSSVRDTDSDVTISREFIDNLYITPWNYLYLKYIELYI